MAKKEISEYDTDMFFLITDDNTNLTEINNNHNVTLINDYLIVQATSVSSEQIFSVAKHTISPTRNWLSTENIRASPCLKTWYEADIIKKINKISTNIII